MRDLPQLKLDLKAPEKFGNVAEQLDEDERRTLANDLMELIGVDETSMGEWLGEAKSFLDSVEADRGNETPQNREQEGSGEEPPPSTEMMLSAVIQFSAKATGALLGEPGLVKTSEPGGEGLASWVSSELRTKDPNWVLDTDPLVVHLGVTGLSWRMRDFEDDEKEFTSHFLPCTDVIINKNVRSVERAPRITWQYERYPYEIERSIQRGHWIDYEPLFEDNDPQAPKRFYQTDLWLDLDSDGIDEPWTITISRDDMAEVVKIKPRWSKKTVVDTKEALYFNPIRRFYPYKLFPNPKGGFFPIGFGKLLNRAESASDRLLASIIDTAESESENGGVMGGSQFGMPDKIELKGNRVTGIPTDGRPLSDAFSPFPVKSVSPGSVQILEKLMTLGDRLAGTLNVMENAPASMSATLAKGIIDDGTQIQSAAHRRLVASMTQEFREFVRMADAYDMLPDGISASDGNGVAVTADPQLATEMQRSALASVFMEMLKAPMIFNPQKTGLSFLQTVRVPNPEDYIVPPQPPQATPWEKMQGAVHLMKQRTEAIKVTGAVAVQLTQALLNMVEAAGGMQNNQAALLTMAQLEHAVQQMMEQAGNAGTELNGMDQQPGNQGAGGVSAPPTGGNGAAPPIGAAGGLGDAGAGSGLQ
jgi:hypothetical protein